MHKYAKNYTAASWNINYFIFFQSEIDLSFIRG
jgi:hypothetical protein